MVNKIFLIILLSIISFFAYAKKDSYKDLNLSWIESIPIFPKLEVDKTKTTEFDSVDGKILIVHVFLNKNHITNMKSFYNEHFQKEGWLKSNKKKDDMAWEKNIGKNRKKQFIMKRKTSDEWSLNYVVENF